MIQEFLNKKTIEELDVMTLKNYVKLKGNNISKKEIKFLQGIIRNRDKYPKEEVAKGVILYTAFFGDEAISYLKKKGVFRYKSFGKNDNYAYYYLQNLLIRMKAFDLSKNMKKYIKQKIKLRWLENFYKDMEASLRKAIRNHYDNRKIIEIGEKRIETTLFLELLSYLEIAFRKERTGKQKISYIDKDLYVNYEKEEVSEAISFLIFLYNDEIGIDENISYWLDSDFVLSREIEDMILIACKINQMIEWEVLIDYYDYTILRSPSKYIMQDKSVSLEKSIRIGYMKRTMQEVNFYLNRESYFENGSIKKVSQYVLEQLHDDIVTFEELGAFSRYRFEINELILKKLANRDDFLDCYEEEKNQIEYLAKELMISAEQLCNRKVTENCTVKDLFILKRFFIFMYFVQEETFSHEEEKKYIATSVTPLFNEENLLCIFDIFTLSRDKSKELLNLFSWSGEGKLDLQYTPIVKMGNKYIVLNGVFALSETFRNFIAHSYYKNNSIVNSDGTADPLISMCRNAFLQCTQSYVVKDTLSYRYEKEKGEIDLLVCSDENIFIFECKDPLMPTSNYEMRSTYDYLEKAQKQLTAAKEALEDSSFRKQYFPAWGIKDNNQNVHTCILLGNRLFSGCGNFTHPIRYIKELKMVLNDGVIRSGFIEWCYWKELKYSEADLICFLSKQDPLTVSFHDSMKKGKQKISYRSKKLIYKMYFYSTKKHLIKLDQCFRTVKKDESGFNNLIFKINKKYYFKIRAKSWIQKAKRKREYY